MVKIITFGCRINCYESQVIKEKLANLTNVGIVNTCCVTKEAERQSCQAIRKIHKENPDYTIVACGCAVQHNPEKFAKMKEVDLVLGNLEKLQTDVFLQKNKDNNEKVFVGDIGKNNKCPEHIITGFDGKQKAFVQIQQGCNHFCSYCIVPFVRGRAFSLPEKKIVEQVQKLLDSRFDEICLTGIDICSYAPSFCDLVECLLENLEIPVLNFGSLDPAKIDDKFINLLKKYKNIAPFLHFSIQSGDNDILKLMRRRHTREQVIDVCQKIKNVRPDLVLGADFICGFPTETLEQFENTLKLVDEAGLTNLHVFPYSQRSGTLANNMPQLPMEERRRRAKILRQKGEMING